MLKIIVSKYIKIQSFTNEDKQKQNNVFFKKILAGYDFFFCLKLEHS